MAQSLKQDKTKSANPNEYGEYNNKRLWALEDFRMGDVGSAIRYTDRHRNVTHPYALDRHVSKYRDDPNKFKSQMQDIIKDLRAENM